jgi:hypothetical protein
MYQPRQTQAAAVEIYIMSNVAVQKVNESFVTCRNLVGPFIDISDSEVSEVVEKEPESELDESKFFMKPKTKKHAAPRRKPAAAVDAQTEVQAEVEAEVQASGPGPPPVLKRRRLVLRKPSAAEIVTEDTQTPSASSDDQPIS